MSLKDAIHKHNNILGASGLSGKAITGVEVYQNGSVIVVEINYSGGSQYVKVNGLQVEVGGSADWNTGTKVL